MISPEIKAYFAACGRKGGKTKGHTKARSPEQARRAALARWAKHKTVNTTIP